jgi:hypothetical protein
MRRFVLAALFLLITLPCRALERWQTLPPTPAPILTNRSGEAEANGIKIHYAICGQGSPVIFLHGGLANSDYWGESLRLRPDGGRCHTEYIAATSRTFLQDPDQFNFAIRHFLGDE